MAKIGCLKPFRGSYAHIKDYVLEDGEIAFDTTYNCIYMGDGTNTIANLFSYGKVWKLVLDQSLSLSITPNTWIYSGISYTFHRNYLYKISTVYGSGKPIGIGIDNSMYASKPAVFIESDGTSHIDTLPLFFSAGRGSGGQDEYYIYIKGSTSGWENPIYIEKM